MATAVLEAVVCACAATWPVNPQPHAAITAKPSGNPAVNLLTVMVQLSSARTFQNKLRTATLTTMNAQTERVGHRPSRTSLLWPKSERSMHPRVGQSLALFGVHTCSKAVSAGAWH